MESASFRVRENFKCKSNQWQKGELICKKNRGKDNTTLQKEGGVIEGSHWVAGLVPHPFDQGGEILTKK
ncbi:hypothetical protein LPTSP3_g27570 [Leptospira kobayashii]|uniref:Uncharacterized protein n=1 Tax=Leptospira kobayashii TaxID=1917830 RepID=A0ABN6KKI7_9LEPT|nr:hypothetical protein LPTSP3_g27570 [Leptospira kobayashii]